jgi:hypothetical protein
MTIGTNRVNYVFSTKKEQEDPMSDNRRVYGTMRAALRQLYPGEPKGRVAQMLNTLAGMIAGIVQGKSCQLPSIANHTPDTAKATSRIKRYERWIDNERVTYEGYYLPFVQELLNNLAEIRELVFVIDGSEIGHGCMALMISLLYGKRALPITWLVVKGKKGHLAEVLHLDLLHQLQLVLPRDCQVVLLGDGEFDGITFQSVMRVLGWQYVCRTAKNTVLYEDGQPFSFTDLLVQVGDQIHLPHVRFTLQQYGPVHAIAWWEPGYAEPIFLISNIPLPGQACHFYKKRFQIETFFSDQKSRGFNLHKSHLSDPNRLYRLLLAASLAYLWIIYLGLHALRHDWIPLIHRPDRCDWSLFRLGLALLLHFLNHDLPIPVSFSLSEVDCVR